MAAPLRVAFVGVGGIAARHLQSLRLLGPQRVRPVAFCDVDLPRAEHAAAAFGGEAYADFTHMLEDAGDLDAVFLCTPPTVRSEPIAAAAARGLAIFCEKPPALDLSEGRRALAAIRRAGVVSNVGFMYRWLGAVDRARELLQGRTVAALRSAFLCGVAVERNLPAWFYLRERSGGPLLDQAIHILDLHRYFAGEVATVHAMANTCFRERSPDFTIEETYTLQLRYAGGAIAGHVHSWACTVPLGELEIISDRARLHLDLLTDRLTGAVDGRAIEERFGLDPYLREVDAFLTAVAERDPTRLRSPYADGLNSAAVAWAGLRSVETGAAEVPERF